MTADAARLTLEPLVSWPREAEAGVGYLVTVDLRCPHTAEEWPFEQEEFTFGVTLDGAPEFVCEVLDDPGVVLHRFGGTYGPARFVVTAAGPPGPAALWLTISNRWGVPVRKAELPSRIVPPADAPEPRPAAGPPGRRPAPGTGRGTPAPHTAPATRPAPAPPTAGGAAGHVTVSFAGVNRAWAVWIADRLERHGLRASLHRWDPPADMPLSAALGDLTLTGGRVLLVLSAGWFQPGVRSTEEWNTALAGLTARLPDRFAAVSLADPARLPSAAAALRPAPLTEGTDAADRLTAEQAERLLLRTLGLAGTPATGATGDKGPRFPLDAPAIWGGVPRRNARFTGRDTLLGHVHDRLERSVRGAAVCTLLGMPGVGKTQLATEYAHRFASEYDVVWWIRADTWGEARQQLAALAPHLGLATGPEYGERLRAVADALRRGSPYRRWLLVLDGADDPEAVSYLLPSGSGHVLITSRNRSWAEYNTLLLEIPVYERAESVAFVRRRAPRLDRDEADRLAEALEDLPLLLDQAAGWLDEATMTVDAYVRLLEDGMQEAGAVVAADFPMTFSTAWTILLHRLRQVSPDAVDLLYLCSFFAPGVVPAGLLGRVRGEFAGLTGTPQRLHDAIGLLVLYSVLGAEEHEDGTETVYLHRMVHLFLRDSLSAADRERYGHAVRRALADADPGEPSRIDRWPAYAALVPHLLPSGALDVEAADMAGLVLNCLRYTYLSGEYRSGLEVARRADRSWRRLLPDDHPRRFTLDHHYANLLRITGDYAASEGIDRAALDQLHRQRGAYDPDTLRAATGLAADLRGLARFQEALDLSGYVLDGSRRTFGEEHPRTLAAQNNVAVSLRLLGDYDQALELDRQTLLARREVLSPEHNWTLFSEIHYATDLRLTGQHGAALALQERNLRSHRRVMGEDNPQTLRAGLSLALCRYHAGQGQRARQDLDRLLERAERVVGRGDPLALMTAAGFSCAEREFGDLDRAWAVGERAYHSYRELLGTGHPYTIGTRANHALVLLAAGETEEGRAVLGAALREMRAAVGPDHPWTRDLAHNTAVTRSGPAPHPVRNFEPLII
ncbi:FxSxx-COOH system tetratricopeptide repeat protein [Streptomyces niger]|uniref:FxSxx-COOH system tetratricopeptide repeat protein n=1 Tax=Streptomyces niger TaxID=66373 RepID=UPI00069C45A2|nr:FxSxx-COOH system tetratricopeptide repeat protein [Streptomyces niger]